MATKTDIRRDIRQLKRMLTDEQKTIAAGKCFSRLEQCPEFIDADRILVYASLPDEISTDAFIRRWHGRKQIFLPRVNGDDLDILPYRPGDTAEGAFGIEEPTGNECRDISEMDLVVFRLWHSTSAATVSDADADSTTVCCTTPPAR